MPTERALPLVGYTGVFVVFLSALSQLARSSREASTATLPLGVLLLAATAAGWALGSAVASRHFALGRCLRLLGDALLPLALMALALGFASAPATRVVERVAPLALAALAFLAVSWRRLARGASIDALYPYFLAGCGAGLLYLGRLTHAASGPTLLWLVLVLAVLLRMASVPSAGEPHFSLAAAALLTTAALAAGFRLGLRTPGEILAALHAMAAVSFVLALRSVRLGPACRALGLAAYVVATVAFTGTLRYLEVARSTYFAAIAAWVLVLAIAGVFLRSWPLEPLRESAHWLAVALGTGLTLLVRHAWWPWAHPLAFEGETQLVAACSLLAVGLAMALVGVWRWRHPLIAASLAGFVGNIGLSFVASYTAPLIVVAGGSALWIAVGGDPSGRPLISLALGAVLLALPLSVDRAYGSAALAFAGALAVILPFLVASDTGPVVLPVLSAAVFFARSLDRRTTWAHVAFLGAVAVAASRMTRDVSGSPDTLGLSLLSVGLLLAYRLFLAREGTRPRSAWVVLAGATVGLWALFRSATAGALAPAPLVLFLGTPAVLAGEEHKRGRTEWEPIAFLSDWAESLAFLVTYGAGSLLVVLVAERSGLPARDIGPVLAAWGFLHLALHRALEVVRPRHPRTIATGLAAWTLTAVSLAFAFRSSSAAIATSTLILNAAFFLLRSFPAAPPPARRMLSAAAYGLSVLAIVLSIRVGGELLPRTLLVAALVYLWHSWRTAGVAVHVLFLITTTAAAVAPPVAWWTAPRALLVSVAIAFLLFVAALTEAFEGRNSRVRLTEAWALALGIALVAHDLSLARFSPWAYLALWAAFLVAAVRWDTRTPSSSTRPTDPEDHWIGVAAYGLAHVAGAAALVSLLLAFPVSWGSAAVALAAWGWLHFAFARSLVARAPERMASAAILPAVHAFAVASLVAAAFARREGGPAALACLLTGLLYLLMSLPGQRRGLVRAAAFAFVEATWLLGLRYGITVAEYYLTALAVFLYVALPARRPGRPAGPDERWLITEPETWMREARGHVLPALILSITVGYAAWALVRTHDEVHLFYLGATAAALLFAFARAGQAVLYTWICCALFLGGALFLFAAEGLTVSGSAFLLAAGALVILNVWATAPLSGRSARQ